MKRTFLVATLCAVAALALAPLAQADPVQKIPVCHKYGTPAQQTLYLPYQGAMGHINGHGDWLGGCPVADAYIDVDGIATPMSGLPMGVNVKLGDPLTAWAPGPIGGNEGIDWFDNDGSCTWTMGDDLHLEDPNGACTTAVRDAFHNLGRDCKTLDIDGSFFDGQQVDVDLEGNIGFTGCPGADPLMKFYDGNGDGSYNDGEDIVLDGNNDGLFN